MYEKIKLFIGGSTNVSSKSYALFAKELGEVINERDYNIIFDGCFGYPYLVYNEIDDLERSVVYYNDLYRRPDVSCCVIQFDCQSNVCDFFINTSDAMIFMKGGSGTIAEVMRAIDKRKNAEHDKPIVIININHEWDLLIDLLASLNISEYYYVCDNIFDCLNYIEKNLYSKDSSFLTRNGSYLDRFEPIIVDFKKLIK